MTCAKPFGITWAGAMAAIVAAGGTLPAAPAQPEGATPELLLELKALPHRIVYESDRDGGWDLFVMNADGSGPVNLTKTPGTDELYPKASPDGARICFVCDEGSGKDRVRNLYVMKADGTGRRKIADNAREPCWSRDGSAVAYLKGEFERYNLTDYVTKGLFIHDLKTGRTREHPNNAKIHHLYTLNWSPDGAWFVATVHGGMGFQHGILALEAAGDKVFNLELEGCRPDLSPDGKRIAWGHGDYAAGVADLDLSGTAPRATGVHNAVESRKPMETYHADWSPDGRYLAYSYGPKIEAKSLKGLLAEFPGVKAPGWNVCVVDTAKKNRWAALTLDGASCKEPDWLPAPGTKP